MPALALKQAQFDNLLGHPLGVGFGITTPDCQQHHQTAPDGACGTAIYTHLGATNALQDGAQ